MKNTSSISRATFLKLGLGAAGLRLLGCAPAPVPASRSASDPSSPTAAAGSDPIALATAGGPKPMEAVVYACPMHPEVTANEPGQVCPKCNMKLVPRK